MKMNEDSIDSMMPTIESIKNKLDVDVISFRKIYPENIPTWNQRKDKTSIPTVYIIFSGVYCRYVGYTKNIVSRIYGLKFRTFSTIDMSVIYTYNTDNEQDGRLLETWLIHELKPDLNLQYPKIYPKIKKKPKNNPYEGRKLYDVEIEYIEEGKKLRYVRDRDDTLISLNTKYCKYAGFNPGVDEVDITYEEIDSIGKITITRHINKGF